MKPVVEIVNNEENSDSD